MRADADYPRRDRRTCGRTSGVRSCDSGVSTSLLLGKCLCRSQMTSQGGQIRRPECKPPSTFAVCAYSRHRKPQLHASTGWLLNYRYDFTICYTPGGCLGAVDSVCTSLAS